MVQHADERSALAEKAATSGPGAPDDQGAASEPGITPTPDVPDDQGAMEDRRGAATMAVLAMLPVAAFLVSLTLGQYPIPLDQLLHVLFGTLAGAEHDWAHALDVVIFNVRIPRVLCALMVGAALSCSGAVYQGVFKNPMVSPDILGASAGAGFGAALAILVGLNALGIGGTAFAFGLVAVGFSVFVSGRLSRGGNAVLMLVLTGMVVQSLFSAFTSIIKYTADPMSKLPDITYWLMGSLNATTKVQVLMMAVPFVIGIVPMLLLRWRINVLSFGEEEARTLGVNIKLTRAVLILCATLLTAASVSICGLVGWVGLVIPHLARLLVGPNYQRLLPASALLGATFMVAVDDVSRMLMSTEVPLSILTAVIGAPFFLYLLFKRRDGWTTQ